MEGNEATDIVWTDGGEEPLPEDVEKCVRTLLTCSDNFVSALGGCSGDKKSDTFFAYLEAIRGCLEEPGIVPWIAARCATELFRSTALGRRDFGPNGLSDDIVQILHKLYRFPDVGSPRGMYLVERLGFGMPLAIRLDYGCEFQPLHLILADFVLKKMDLEIRKRFVWLHNIPLPPMVVGPLITLCREEMENVLRFIGSRAMPIEPLYYYDRRMRVQDTRRILKVARETEDQDVLRGAAAALINATFARLCEPALVQRILTAAPGSPLVARVFSTQNGIRGREEESELRELAKEVASMVVDNPETHPFDVVNRAAVFLSEVNTQRNTPLFEESPELQKSSAF